MKYLNAFGNHSVYTGEKTGLPRPSVSYCAEEKHVHYNGKEMVFTVNLNTDEDAESELFQFIFHFMDLERCEEIRLDGEHLDTDADTPPTVTAGEHVVEFAFPRMTVCPGMGCGVYATNMSIESIIIPEGIKRIESYPCQDEDDCFDPSIGQMCGATLSIPSTLEYVGVRAICDEGVVISEEDMARLDSLCPVQPEQEGDHPWMAPCSK